LAEEALVEEEPSEDEDLPEEELRPLPRIARSHGGE
jgi:hypothetical protein